jgi:hypothetical protein
MRTVQIPWYALRTAVIADDTALATFDYASWPTSNTIEVESGTEEGISTLLHARRLWVGIYGKAVADATAGYKLYARRKDNGPILLLASGIATLGSQLVTKDPISEETITAYWADTITITGGLWSDMAPLVLDSGNNRIALLRGRNEGLKDYYLEVDLNGAGTGTYMTELNAIISGTEDA